MKRDFTLFLFVSLLCRTKQWTNKLKGKGKLCIASDRRLLYIYVLLQKAATTTTSTPTQTTNIVVCWKLNKFNYFLLYSYTFLVCTKVFIHLTSCCFLFIFHLFALVFLRKLALGRSQFMCLHPIIYKYSQVHKGQ